MTTHLGFLSQTALAAEWRVLVDVAIKGAIVLTAASTLALAMRRALAAMRHLVWTLAIYGVLALPVLAALLPGWRILPVWMNWEPAIAQPLAPHMERPAAIGEIPRNLLPPEGFAAEVPALDGQTVVASQAAERSRSIIPPTAARPPALRRLSTVPAPQRPASRWTKVSWQSWVLIAWGCGTAVMLLPVVASLLGLWRLGRQAARIEGGSWDLLLRDLSARLKFPRSVMLLRGQSQAMPMTWGIIRLKLLLPPEADDWPMDRRRVVLMHELAHIRRCDFLTQLLVHVARALYWFNPLIWIASKQIAVESEGACDDLVVSQETKPSDYAEHLLTIVTRLRGGALIPVAAIAMARSSKLEARLVGILDDKRNRRSLTAAGVVLAAVMVISGVLPLAMLHSARAQDSKATSANPKPTHATDSPAPAKSDSAPKDDAPVQIDAPGSVAPYDRVPAGGGTAPVQPVPIVFSIPQDAVQSVVRKFDAHQALIVDVYDGHDATRKLGHGSLAGIDNQIDEQTGMLKCKAVVTPIGDALLFPNQFVNVRLILETQHAGAEGNANRDVLTVELQHAKAQADRLQKAFQVGAVARSELEAAKDKVDELEAELTGDSAQVRKVKLAAAQRRLQTAALLYKANALSASEYDQAKYEVDVLEAEVANDPVRVARVKLDYAVRRFEVATTLHNAAMLTNAEFEKAKAEADIAETRLRALQVRITGMVVDPDGNPVAGATVAPADGTGNSLTGDTSYSVPTAQDGTFVITLPPGGNAKYNLEAHDGNQAQWRKWANGVLPPIQTKPGDEIKNLVIMLTRPATVRGHVNDESGKPLVDREVRASAADMMENRYYDPTTRTDKDGNFELHFIRPGKQFIQAAPFFWCNVPPGGMTLELKEGQTNSLAVTLKEGETREGVELTGPASTQFPSSEEQLRRAIERSEKSPNELNKSKGADPGKKEGAAEPSTQPRIMEVKLESARRELDISAKRFAAGLIDTLEYQEAKDKVRILEAELSGDALRVAEARLAAARAQLQITESQHKAGILTELDLEKAKSKVAIAEVELRVAADKAAVEKPAPSRSANEGTTKPAAAYSKTATERGAKLKAEIRNFKLDLQYNGPQDKPYYRLRLSVAPVAGKDRTNPFDVQSQITEDQARTIIDYLTRESFLDTAHSLQEWGFIPAATQPGYSLTVMNYYSDLGWKLPMLKRLDGLRSALEGDAGKSMDLLLGRLDGERKLWTPGR